MRHLIGFTDVPLAPDKDGWTPIHFVAVSGNLETVKFLVGLTQTPNAQDYFGNTPIDLAERFGNVEVQKFLENYCK